MLQIVGVGVGAFLQQAVAGVCFAMLGSPYQGCAILMEDLAMVENGVSDCVQDFRCFGDRIHILYRWEEEGSDAEE